MPKRDALIKKDVVYSDPPETPWWWINPFVIFQPVWYLVWDVPRTLLRVARGEPLISPFESAILDIAVEHWPEETAEIVRSQMKEINYVNRMCYKRSSETILYKSTPFGLSFKRKKMFSYPYSETVILATVHVHAEGVKVGCDILVLEQSLWGFEFDRDMTYLHRAGSLEVLKVDIDPSPINQFGDMA
ncbi:hypothetical protein [Jannaschia pohangensis]|uniref:Uncharacterized protein n=1 Tax=Jannaschia pohangensis TaxID=390807 RepID=A0A1I3JZX9_9RHOB|nr:hypothetical protein [Jannaschia pohangensis]SFI65736.1 hypothetical protein SAMN04488095_1488 [Jannaschia pohangensis]